MLTWLIQTGENHPFQTESRKMRTGILADYLHSQGQSIVWWSSNFYHPQKILLSPAYKEVKIADNFSIKLLRGIPYQRNISLTRFRHYKCLAKNFAREARRSQKPDLIITALPDYNLSYEAVKFAKENDIPIIVDIRDLWPDIFLNHVPRLLKPLAKLVLSQDFKKVDYLTHNATSITAVSEGYLDWALGHAKRKPGPFDGVFYHGYQRPEIQHNSESLDNIKKIIAPLSTKTLFTFIGTFGRSYDLETIAKSAAKISSIHPEAHFILAGDGEQFKSIQKLCEPLENVTLTGWLKKHELDYLLKHSHVGLAACISIKDTMPNKPFEYLAYGLPVISSLTGDMQSLLEKYQIGFYYSAKSVDNLTSVIAKLLKTPETRIEISQKANKLFEEKFAAKTIYNNYYQLIQTIVKSTKGRVVHENKPH